MHPLKLTKMTFNTRIIFSTTNCRINFNITITIWIQILTQILKNCPLKKPSEKKEKMKKKMGCVKLVLEIDFTFCTVDTTNKKKMIESGSFDGSFLESITLQPFHLFHLFTFSFPI